MAKQMQLIRPQKSGWCGNPQTTHPEESHARCQRQGGGNTARPSKEFQPCPCPCHYADLEKLECGCGRVLVETNWPNYDPTDVDENGDLYPVYVHIASDGSLIGQDCP